MNSESKTKNDGTKVSRRRFLGAAVASAATATAAGADAVDAETEIVDPDKRRLEEIVAAYGGEFGDLRKVR
jgi:hypothetical protein